MNYISICEKNTGTIYITVFSFRILSNVVRLCIKDLENADGLTEKKSNFINKNILDILDTLKNIFLIFNLLIENSENVSFKDEIFMSACNFANKLFSVRTESMQVKFQAMFFHHPSSQSFFKRIEDYLTIYENKIKRNLLREHLSKARNKKIFSVVYYENNNLEKLIITLLMNLCKGGNEFMQNYLKEQTLNNTSYNFVEIINEFAKSFQNHMCFMSTFDIFLALLKCLFEFVQGPNQTNQKVLINNDFINLANEILNIRYHDDDKKIPKEAPSTFEEPNIPSSKVAPSNNTAVIIENEIKPETVQTQDPNDFYKTPATNYQISLAKYQVLMLLNALLDGFSPNDYVYYLYRRELHPDKLRLNFAYQEYLLTKFHKSEYKLNLFFQYQDSVDKEKDSPFIIEIGFLLYFLIKKMEKNLRQDENEVYNQSILRLLPSDKGFANVQVRNIVVGTIYFYYDWVKIIIKFFQQNKSTIKKEDIEAIQMSDQKMEKIFNFYERYSSRIEILKNDTLHEQYLIRLPY